MWLYILHHKNLMFNPKDTSLSDIRLHLIPFVAWGLFNIYQKGGLGYVVWVIWYQAWQSDVWFTVPPGIHIAKRPIYTHKHHKQDFLLLLFWIKACWQEMTALWMMALHNFAALDYALACQGGTCAVIGAECCTFIPDHNVTYTRNTVTIAETLHYPVIAGLFDFIFFLLFFRGFGLVVVVSWS